MKRSRRSITDLSNDVLKHILIHVAKSLNGPLNLARTLSVCRVFRELAHDKAVLTAVAYNNASLPLFHPSFWRVNGLVVRCLCLGNVTAIGIQIKYISELNATKKALERDSMLRHLDLQVKKRAVKTVNTRLRCKALESAFKKYDEVIRQIDGLREKCVQQVQGRAHLVKPKSLPQTRVRAQLQLKRVEIEEIEDPRVLSIFKPFCLVQYRIMKRSRRSITDLSNDVLKHILIHVAKSLNGPLNLARALSVCRVFRELAQDKMVLTAVAYNNATLPLFHPSFWQVDGLVVRCLCVGNVTANGIKRKYSSALHATLKVLARDSTSRILDLMDKTRAVKTVNTRLRCKALESASKKYDEVSGHMDDLEEKLVQLDQVHLYVKSHLSSGNSRVSFFSQFISW